jgi:nucleotide-binding universal stress UspA family protein
MNKSSNGFHRVLAATDFSPSGDAAVRQALWAAALYKAPLVVAHVIADVRKAISQTSYRSRIEFLEGQEEHFQRELRLLSDARLKAAIRQLARADRPVRYETLLGKPYVEIIHTVQQENYDLVVVGAGQQRVLDKLLIGSTAKQLVRKCPAAVWIAKGKHGGAVRTILAAVDLSDVSRRALVTAAALAQRSGAKLHVVHVVECVDMPAAFLELKAAKGGYGTVREAIDHDARGRFDQFLHEAMAAGSAFDRHFLWGQSWQEVVKLAENLSVDLIALGSVGRSGFEGILLGNTAENVLAHSDCSVLTVKPADFVSPVAPATWQLHPGPEEHSEGVS